MSELRVFKNDVTEWVIARSPEDASAVLLEHYQTTGCDSFPPEQFDWEECPLDAAFTYHDDNDGSSTTKLFQEWVVEKGRGFLATTEF